MLEDVRGKDIQREMVPMVQYAVLYGLKTLFGIESMNALPELLFSDEASMRLVGFKAQQVRHGVCRRGMANRQGPRQEGPICPDALANNLVKMDLRALETLFNSTIRTLVKAGLLRAQVTGIVDGTDLETTAQYEGCGHVIWKRKLTDKYGKVREIEVMVSGWKVIVLIDAFTKLPLAVQVVPIQEQETLSLRVLVTQAWTNLAGHARLHKVVFDRGFLAGTDLWWLDQRGITSVVTAKEDMAVTTDAQALAAAGTGSPWSGGRTPSAMGRAMPRGVNGWNGGGGHYRADDLRSVWDGRAGAPAQPPRLPAQPQPCRGGARVAQPGLWAGGQNRVLDECLRAAAFAAV